MIQTNFQKINMAMKILKNITIINQTVDIINILQISYNNFNLLNPLYRSGSFILYGFIVKQVIQNK